jgi:hypothetical protein
MSHTLLFHPAGVIIEQAILRLVATVYLPVSLTKRRMIFVFTEYVYV